MSWWDDYFTGDNGSFPSKWINTSAGSGVAEIQSNKLRLDNYGGAGNNARAQSKMVVSGDFDIQIDLDGVTHPPDTGWEALIEFRIDSTHYYWIAAWEQVGSARWQAGYANGGSETYPDYATRTSDSGSLRITRSGSTVRVYYDESKTDTWTEVDSGGRSIGSGQGIITLKVLNWTGYPQAVFDFDDFLVNSGDFSTTTTSSTTTSSTTTTSTSSTTSTSTTTTTSVTSSSTSTTNPCPFFDYFYGNNNDPLNSVLWTYDTATSSEIYIYNNKCRVDLTGVTGAKAIRSKFFLRGDFDIQIDLDLISGVPSSNGWFFGLGVVSIDNPSTVYAKIWRSYWSGFTVRTNVDGSQVEPALGTLDEPTGLRIVRSGTTVTLYIWDDSSWKQARQVTSWTTDDLYVYLDGQTWGIYPDSIADFDNFRMADCDSGQFSSTTTSTTMTTSTTTTSNTQSSTTTSSFSTTSTTTPPINVWTDFSEYNNLDDLIDFDWSEPWRTGNNNFTVETTANTLGGKCLHLDNTTGTGRNPGTWDEIPAVADGEALYKVKKIGTDYECRCYMRVTGSTGSEYSYFTEVYLQRLRISKYVNSVYTNIALDSGTTVPSDEWIWIRFRVDGTSLKAKWWRYSEQEPGSWNIETTDSDVTSAGLVGIGPNAGEDYFDYFGFDQTYSQTAATTTTTTTTMTTSTTTTSNTQSSTTTSNTQSSTTTTSNTQSSTTTTTNTQSTTTSTTATQATTTTGPPSTGNENTTLIIVTTC